MICYKKFLIAILIFLFVFCFTSSVFGAVTTVDPTEQYVTSEGGYGQQNDNGFLSLQQYQLNIQNRFIAKLHTHIGENNYKSLVRRLYDQIRGIGSNGKFLYFSEQYSGYEASYNVYMSYLGDLRKGVANGYTIINETFSNVATLTGTFYNIGGINSDGAWVTPSNNPYHITETKTLPLAHCTVLSYNFVQLFKDYGLIADTSSDEVVNAINQSNADITNQINNSADKINDNINNNDTSEIDTSGITNSDTTVDITQDGFNSIFTTLQNYFTSGSGGSLTLTIPFVNKSFTISKSSVYGNFKQLSTIENLASLVWYFVISLYIVKQVQNMINKIKSGNLEDVVDNNVKADIL